MVQEKINRGRHIDHPAGRATPSGLTSVHLRRTTDCQCCYNTGQLCSVYFNTEVSHYNAQVESRHISQQYVQGCAYMNPKL